MILVMEHPYRYRSGFVHGFITNGTSTVVVALLVDRPIAIDDQSQARALANPAGYKVEPCELVQQWLLCSYQLCFAQTASIAGAEEVHCQEDTGAVRRNLVHRYAEVRVR